MTGQIPDNVLYNDEIYDLVGLKGEGLYEPFDFGLTPVSPHTANWRGFISHYEVSKKILTLKDFEVHVQNSDDNLPDINGVKPIIRIEGLTHLKYENVNLKTNYTGTILIARDFINSLYVHMGFQSPLSFNKVIEFEFNNGKLISEKDLSKKMKIFRKEKKFDGKINVDEDISKWINRTFSLDYDF